MVDLFEVVEARIVFPPTFPLVSFESSSDDGRAAMMSAMSSSDIPHRLVCVSRYFFISFK